MMLRKYVTFNNNFLSYKLLFVPKCPLHPQETLKWRLAGKSCEPRF